MWLAVNSGLNPPDSAASRSARLMSLRSGETTAVRAEESWGDVMDTPTHSLSCALSRGLLPVCLGPPICRDARLVATPSSLAPKTKN